MGWFRRSIGVAAVSLLAGGAGAVAATAPVGQIYAGETSQNEIMTLSLNLARTKVKLLRTGISGPCTPAPGAAADTATTFATSWLYDNIPLRGTRPWATTERFDQTVGDVRWTGTARYTGRFSGDRMIGTITVTINETTPQGALIRTCRTGKLTYRLSNRNVYGGLTAQRLPGYITLNARGNRLAIARWEWRATCTRGPAAKPETLLETFLSDAIVGPLPVAANGAFRVTTEAEPIVVPEAGLTVVFTNSVKGRRVGKRIRGTFTGKFVETETATGAVVRTCSSPATSFTLTD
jgi:hypothetical protein